MASNLSGVVRRAVLAAVEDISKQQEEQLEAAESLTFREVGGISGVAWAATAKVHHSASSTGASTPAAVMSHDEAEHEEDLMAATPAAMAAVFLRRLEDQLHELHYSSGVDDAGEVLGGLHGAALLHHPSGSLRAVVDRVADACVLAEDAAGPAAVRLLRSLSAAVGRMAASPQADVASDKAAAVVTCLTGMCEAFEGAKKKTTTATCSPASSMGSVDFWEEYASAHAQATSKQQHGSAAATASVPMEAAALLREAAAVLDCIASNKCDIASHPAGANGHVTMSAPHIAHPLLALLEARLYARDTWEPQSPADIACSLVELVAAALSPGHAGNTLAPGGTEARNMASSTLRAMVSAQHTLIAALRGHEADPAAAGRLLAALAEALGAAAIARDTFNPSRGPRSMTMFGEAQLLAGLSRMCTGEAMKHMSMADQQGRPDNEPTMVLEVLAEQARDVAEAHRRSITRVLEDLHAVPKSLGELSKLPGEALVQHQAAAAAAAARAARRAASTANGSATETLNLLRRTAAGLGHAASTTAAASVAADGKSGVGSTVADAMKQKKEEPKQTAGKA
ncbi:hypothetical protein HXX76_007286 [Chlamydomonas incerta]|uniref:Uncharacterized protein n=1 Tax=Chlamydomonas incerta TaxID=51695 RepID=A0A835SXZ9_CHLIN|nr:hypothetical protein HXX76_007286 [Chlamydomonas incerta]|eukprot:KAG2435203.1 hypothetical protein HXX76_007286 [Chlamydomonas incerta]